MPRFARQIFLLPVLLALTLVQAPAGNEKELRFEAVLIWGTDAKKPEGKNLKDVETGLTEKLRKIFKWRNYYVVKRAPFSVQPGESGKHLRLSDKCTMNFQYDERHGLEVELFGEGKFVAKATQSMPLTDILVLAGDDKNATAWFVVIKPRDQ